MSILEEYDRRCSREPLTPDRIVEHIDAAERFLERADKTYAVETERVICWLHDRLQAIAGRAGTSERMPAAYRCGWCHKTAGSTEDAWRSLPEFTLDGIRSHTETCEHNPLVQRCRAAEATLEDLKGRRIGNADAWAEAADEATKMYQLTHELHGALKNKIRALLKTELPAGELRKALEELVR